MTIHIEKPSLLLNVERTKANIHFMANKAQSQGIRFRPHFKTHQSAIIGEWFREAGVTVITVSSVEMAQYFARRGWNDITIAFPVNLRQIAAINALAQSIHLGLLVESIDSLNLLHEKITSAVDIWIEIDDGSNRSGLRWDKPERVIQLAETVKPDSLLKLCGLLTHAGRIYQAGSPAEIRRIYAETVDRMNSVRQFLMAHGLQVEVSVGDTPGCTLSPELGTVDEIRPGNFVFYDGMQLELGVCQLQQIAAVVACPVVARYPERSEVVIYGGAVHLSKDTVKVDGQSRYGLIGIIHETTKDSHPSDWLSLVPGGYVTRVTQEHGVVALPKDVFDQVQDGSLVYIIPAHVCLTVSALGEYLSLDGQKILTLNKEV